MKVSNSTCSYCRQDLLKDKVITMTDFRVINSTFVGLLKVQNPFLILVVAGVVFSQGPHRSQPLCLQSLSFIIQQTTDTQNRRLFNSRTEALFPFPSSSLLFFMTVHQSGKVVVFWLMCVFVYPSVNTISQKFLTDFSQTW